MSIRLYVNQEFGPEWSIISFANPNRLGWVGLIRLNSYYIAFQEDPDGGECHEVGTDFLSEAAGWYNEMVEERVQTPNWELQAEYDAIWGSPLEHNWEH